MSKYRDAFEAMEYKWRDVDKRKREEAEVERKQMAKDRYAVALDEFCREAKDSGGEG